MEVSVPVFSWQRWWEVPFFIFIGLMMILFLPCYFGIHLMRKHFKKEKVSQ